MSEEAYFTLVSEIGRARHAGRLTDDLAREICAGFGDPMPSIPPPAGEAAADEVKIELIIRVARAHGKGTLTDERMRETAARLAMGSRSERPARLSMSPEILVSPVSEDDEELADVADVEDLSEPKTDPPPAG